jgi:tRNA nucleotidyltransferase (CCA-adding enzyme)
MANNNLNQHVKRSELGMLIRDLGALWQTAIKMTTTKELLETYPNLAWSEDPNAVDFQTGQDICNKYYALIQAAEQYQITDCYTWKHMVDGKRAAQVVGIKTGPMVTELLKIQMAWQLENPSGTKEECEQAIKAYWDNK